VNVKAEFEEDELTVESLKSENKVWPLISVLTLAKESIPKLALESDDHPCRARNGSSVHWKESWESRDWRCNPIDVDSVEAFQIGLISRFQFPSAKLNWSV